MPRPRRTIIADCEVLPDSVALYQDVTVSGSGFPPSSNVSVIFQNERGDVGGTPTLTDSAGEFSLLYHTVWEGTNHVTAWTKLDKVTYTASCDFEVN